MIDFSHVISGPLELSILIGNFNNLNYISRWEKDEN